MQKKTHRFLIPSITSGDTVTITDPSIVHHIRSVLRLTQGEHISVFADGGPEVEGSIGEISAAHIALQNLQTITTTPLPRKVIAVVSIVKRDLFEIVVQKLTEIGVQEIVPLIAMRTIKQSVRVDRLKVISDEALEQCGGINRVVIHEPITLEQTMTLFPFESIVFDTNIQTPLKKDLPDTVVYFIGPEGGWTDAERILLEQYGAQHASLGTRILRAETAAIVAADRLLCN